MITLIFSVITKKNLYYLFVARRLAKNLINLTMYRVPKISSIFSLISIVKFLMSTTHKYVQVLFGLDNSFFRLIPKFSKSEHHIVLTKKDVIRKDQNPIITDNLS